ncbi:conserved hypothetical protein [Frankia canadensis]|uniref:Uncharacterized protein n=1 Tax=Frankia canadensis TaxID=1836972 RepID=A0A2I2KM51_9ACTN|nr:hypothetical protein [Frankia canadensis]SNQ46745.1 conserved hypothetical protein [Frankia canadensis]SOU54035.1 conserved hypothetical protein [Frankia canadensis]
MTTHDQRTEQAATRAAEGERLRPYHAGAPEHLDDDALARRTEEERADAGLPQDAGQPRIPTTTRIPTTPRGDT